MKLITRNVDYAIRALCVIAKCNNNLISVSELVEKTGIPRQFLRRILQVMARHGIVGSFKGQGGGFSLAAVPDRIYLVDLMEIFQGSVKINECTFKRKTCPNITRCAFRKKLESIQDHVIRELQDITLSCLLKKGKTRHGKKKNHKNR